MNKIRKSVVSIAKIAVVASCLIALPGIVEDDFNRISERIDVSEEESNTNE